MRKIKVLQIIPSFGVGGAEKLVLDYLTHFNTSTIEVKVISLYAPQNTIYDEIIKEKDLNVIYLNKKNGIDFRMVSEIRKIVKNFKPDVIHTHLHTMKYAFFSWNKRNTKIFHTIHNEPIRDASKLDKLFNKLAFKYRQAIPIALTDELAIKTNKFYNIKKTVVLNNGINLENINAVKKSKEEIRNELNLPPNSFIVGHIGRFTKQKNHEFIIDIFDEFYKSHKDSYIVLVGDGELKKNIEEKVESLRLKERVIFMGVRNNIPEILKSMDVFLFPSFHEGFPLTLIEAQAADITCVISDQIDKKAVLSKNTHSLSLDDSINKWCEFIKLPKIGDETESVLDFDINIVVEKLESLYRTEPK